MYTACFSHGTIQPTESTCRAIRPVGIIVDEEGTPYTEYEDNIPNIITRDTPLFDLLQNDFLYYSGADIAALSVSDPDTYVKPGPVRKCDISRLYKFSNSLSKVRMTGKQLLKFMEYSAAYYKTCKEGDIPEIIEEKIGQEIGAVPDMIADYIANVCGGKLELSCDDNWKLVFA